MSTDSTPPVNAISASTSSGHSAKVANTVFYRGVVAGAFTMTNAVSDLRSGPASSTTASLGTAAGWTHVPSTVTSPASGPYVSTSFGWAALTTSSPTEVVTGRDVAGNTADTTLSFVNDSTAPTSGSVSYPDGIQPGHSVVVTFAAGTDAGSGIATRQLQRSSATLAAGVCGAFSSFVDVGVDSPTTPFTDSQVADNTCYRYQLVVTDRVANQDVAVSANVARIGASTSGPNLGSAGPFSVLAVVGVVNTGLTTISGDVGVSPAGTISGFPPGIIAGTVHTNDTAAALAQTDLHLAYLDAAARAPTANFAGDNNGRTYGPGVYKTAAAFALTGTMTLDAEGDPNATFIFQIGAAMNTAAASNVNLINGATAANVYWQVLGATGTGANSTLSGTIMSSGAITLGAGSQLIGRAQSFDTVTLAANPIRFTSALPPVITIVGGSTAVTKNPTPTISGTTNAATGSTVTVKILTQTLTASVQAGGTWSVTATVLAAGLYPVAASVRDAAGNAGTAAQDLTVEVNPSPVATGSAGAFSILSATGVSSTGSTTVSGDLGVSPIGAVAGFPPGIVAGDTHTNDSAAAAALIARATAYNDAAGRSPGGSFAGDQNGRTFHAGVHRTSAAFALTGTMTLDAEGDPDAVFIFQIGAAMNTAAASNVALVNGAKASNVYWQVSGAVGTGASSSLSGTVLANGAVTLGAGAQLIGRALALGTVTLANNTIRFTSALPPSIAITGGATALTKQSTPTISGTTDAVAGATVTVKVDAQTLSTAVTGGGTWSVAAAAVAAGPHVVTASVRDAAGNAGTATQVLTVELTPAMVALGAASSFSALSGLNVINTGATTLSGHLGAPSTLLISGFPPGVVGGVTHAGTGTYLSARTALTSAFTDAAGRAAGGSFAGDQNGKTFHAGVFHTSAAFALTGTMTLDAEGDPNAVFIFQIDAAMNTAAASQVVLANGAQASRVFWQVNGATGTGASSTLVGTILCNGAISLGAGAQLSGRALAYGTTTFSTNAITTS